MFALERRYIPNPILFCFIECVRIDDGKAANIAEINVAIGCRLIVE